MILKGEEYCVNVEVFNLSSCSPEFEDSTSFVQGANNTVQHTVAAHLRRIAEDIENNVQFEDDEND